MSVLVMSEEAHATLAEVIRTVLDEGYNFFGFEASMMHWMTANLKTFAVATLLPKFTGNCIP